MLCTLPALAAVLELGEGEREGLTRATAHTLRADPIANSEDGPAKAPRREMPRPVHIAIPAIDVFARIVALGLNPDRTLKVPKNLADAGWFTEGPEPGERGAAVVVGHVASLGGPGVFYRLRDLRAGDVIKIRLRDGEVIRYRSRSTVVVPKTHFPTKRVYAQTALPTLRLITCSGTLDASTGRHPENRIVFASLLDVG